MKTHSREWFLQQIENAKKESETWPLWMREGKKIATASFPRVGDEEVVKAASAASGSGAKKKGAAS